MVEKRERTRQLWRSRGRGPHGSNTADGAGSLNHGLLLLFLRYGTPDWAKEKRKGFVHLWVF